MMFIYRIKAVVRWLRYQMRLGVSYHTYDPDIPGGVVDMGYLGWYEQLGQCIAFRNTDNEVQFLW